MPFEETHVIRGLSKKPIVFGAVCDRYGISRKTGYKWMDRWPSRAKVWRIERVDPGAHGYGRWSRRRRDDFAKIRTCRRSANCSRQTMHNILVRHDLVPRRRRTPLAPGSTRYQRRTERDVDADFKGSSRWVTVSCATRLLCHADVLVGRDNRRGSQCSRGYFANLTGQMTVVKAQLAALGTDTPPDLPWARRQEAPPRVGGTTDPSCNFPIGARPSGWGEPR